MDYVLAVVILLIWLAAVLRQRRLLPGIVVATILAVNILSFYLIQFLQLADLIHIEHSYKYKSIYLGDEYPFLLTFGSVIFAICLPYLRRSLRGGVSEKSEQKVNRNAEYYVTTASFVLFFISIFHAFESNFAFLGNYTTYLAYRDPENLNITNDIIQVFHANIGSVGVILSVIVGISFKRYWAAFFFSILPYIYVLLFEAAVMSRWLVIQLIVPVAIVSMRSRYRWVIMLLAMGAVVPIYAAVIDSRSERVFGIETVAATVFEGANLSGEFFVSTIGNIFGGGLNASEAALKLNVSYPTNYMVLSFSPLPSVIDGFDEINHLYQVRINVYGPFNAFIEAYWFGWPWFILFAGIIIWTARANDRLYLAKVGSSSIVSIIPSALLYYGIFFSTQYPLRNSVRWMILSAILIPVLSYGARRRSSARRVASRVP